jgi:3-oxoadipate enol-lactonase
MARRIDAPPQLPVGTAVELPGRGTTFVHEVAGPPGAPVVVLLHGWTATAALNWFPSFAPLGRHFRVLAVDHRGHGRGIRSRQPFRLEDCADDAAALAEQWAIPRLIPVGYSMGGPVATLMWRRHRDLVQGLVLCATAARFTGLRPADRILAPWMLSLSVAASLSPSAVRQRAMTRFVHNRLNGTDLSDWAAGELSRNDPAALLRAGAALGSFDARGWLRSIDVPTAVVVTELDEIVPPAYQTMMAASIPGAESFTVAGDHSVCGTAPSRFVPVLVAACQSVARRAATPSPADPLPSN